MTRQLKDNVLIYGLSLLIGVLVMTVLITILHFRFENQMEEDAKAALTKVDHVSASVIDTLKTLNKEPYTSCTEDVLLAMRKQLFLSDYIKDIGFLPGGLLTCTTGVGQIATPFKGRDPDFVKDDGTSVWLKQTLVLFERKITGFIFRIGIYNVVVDESEFKDLLESQVSWELVLADGFQYKSIAGDFNLYHQLENQRSSEYWFDTQLCSNQFPYCFAIAAPTSVFVKKYKMTLYAYGIISVLVFLFTLSKFKLALIRYRSVESRIIRGLKTNAYYCLYQPIVDLSNYSVIGCEVLARFKDSDGEISPLVFIPIIIKHKLTWAFTQKIITKVKYQLTPALKAASSFKININFFANDLASGDILELVTKHLLDNNVFQYVIEITEAEELAKEESTLTFARLSKAGFHIAIDDFGTGYSNLSQVQGFNCQTLKIDRSFVNEMEGKSIRSTLIPHIVEIAKEINANIVAEGIENRMQCNSLKEVGVHFGQGYMFGKPMEVGKLNQAIKESKHTCLIKAVDQAYFTKS